MKKLITVFVCFLVFSGMNLLPGQTKTEPQNKQIAVTAEALSPANEAELRSVRDQLFKFLRMSPRLTMAISTDPSLLSFPEYVNKHNPGLADFIQGHPEIARNPEFYLFAHLPGGGGQNVPFLFQRAVWPEVGRGRTRKTTGYISCSSSWASSAPSFGSCVCSCKTGAGTGYSKCRRKYTQSCWIGSAGIRNCSPISGAMQAGNSWSWRP